jgi:hypothetical protein
VNSHSVIPSDMKDVCRFSYVIAIIRPRPTQDTGVYTVS